MHEEFLNPSVFTHSCASQVGKIVVENLIKRWSQAFAVLEQSHPPSITQQDVVQQSMNAAERSGTSLSVLDVIQLRALRKKPLVRHAVVPGQHLKMSH